MTVQNAIINTCRCEPLLIFLFGWFFKQMSTSIYKNILLIGAGGNLGKPILSALRADSTFNVTVLSRADSAATFSSDVKVIKADYSNKDAMVKALTGQDVVISAVASAAYHRKSVTREESSDDKDGIFELSVFK